MPVLILSLSLLSFDFDKNINRILTAQGETSDPVFILEKDLAQQDETWSLFFKNA